MEELRRYDVQVIEPPDMEIPPHKRGLSSTPQLSYSTGMGRVPAGKDDGPALTNDRTPEES